MADLRSQTRIVLRVSRVLIYFGDIRINTHHIFQDLLDLTIAVGIQELGRMSATYPSSGPLGTGDPAGPISASDLMANYIRKT